MSHLRFWGRKWGSLVAVNFRIGGRRGTVPCCVHAPPRLLRRLTPETFRHATDGGQPARRGRYRGRRRCFPPRPQKRETGELTIGNPGRSPSSPLLVVTITELQGEARCKERGETSVKRCHRWEAFQASEESRGKFFSAIPGGPVAAYRNSPS